MKTEERDQTVMLILHECHAENVTLQEYCRKNNISIPKAEYTYRKLLCPSGNKTYYNLMFSTYLEISKFTDRRGKKMKQFCVREGLNYGSFSIYFDHFNHLQKTAKYIEDNHLNVPLKPHVKNALDVLNGDKAHTETETEKVDVKVPKIGFSELKKTENESPPPPVEHSVEQSKEPEYYPNNDIEITNKSGVKVSIPSSVQSETVFKIINFVRSL